MSCLSFRQSALRSRIVSRVRRMYRTARRGISMAVTAADISRWSSLGMVILLALTLGSVVSPVHAADDGFTRFLAAVWPEAQQAGVSRATFDSVTAGLEPDYKLPDLILPGRPATGAPSQAEFVQVPADYVREASIAGLAAEG